MQHSVQSEGWFDKRMTIVFWLTLSIEKNVAFLQTSKRAIKLRSIGWFADYKTIGGYIKRFAASVEPLVSDPQGTGPWSEHKIFRYQRSEETSFTNNTIIVFFHADKTNMAIKYAPRNRLPRSRSNRAAARFALRSITQLLKGTNGVKNWFQRKEFPPGRLS